MSSKVFLSVIIPTFHRNESLGHSLGALSPGHQTLSSDLYEVIVSDAGTRSSAEAMMEGSYPWARWVGAPGASPGTNRNTGARLARGEWLVFVDDDCRISSGFLAGYYELAKTGLFDVLEGKITCKEKTNSPFRREVENLHGGVFITGNIAIRREVFIRVGPFDEDLQIAEDLEMGQRLKIAGARSAFCPEATVDHPSQVIGWRELVKIPLNRRWALLLRFKLQESQFQTQPLLFALAQTLLGELIFNLRITWHLYSQHDSEGWPLHWFGAIWAWIWLPMVIPWLWYWELRYRRMIAGNQICIRPLPSQS